MTCHKDPSPNDDDGNRSFKQHGVIYKHLSQLKFKQHGVIYKHLPQLKLLVVDVTYILLPDWVPDFLNT
jgi:hypothetical protein